MKLENGKREGERWLEGHYILRHPSLEGRGILFAVYMKATIHTRVAQLLDSSSSRGSNSSVDFRRFPVRCAGSAGPGTNRLIGRE